MEMSETLSAEKREFIYFVDENATMDKKMKARVYKTVTIAYIDEL